MVIDLHVAGAQELATYLTDELKLEKQSSCSQLPKLHGFQLVNTTGPSVVLTRKYYNEMYIGNCASFYCWYCMVVYINNFWLVTLS